MTPTTTFAALHVPGQPLLLVNAWDVASAAAFAAAGHPAVGTTSLGITAAAGVADGAGAGRDLTVALAAVLARRLPVPLTVDLEGGYSDDASQVAALVAELATHAVAGVNLEDAGRSPQEHAAVVAAVKAAAPGLFVNARTDVYWSGSGDRDDALRRCRFYRDAGADGLFVPGLADLRTLERVVAIGLPVNVLWQPGGADVAAVGVARISTGSALYRHALAAGVDAAEAARAGRAPRTAELAYAEVQQLVLAFADDAPARR